MNESCTGGQYCLYRVLLGGFLVVHFSLLLPYGAEVFGAGGVLASASLSPFIGVLPNPLAYLDSPLAIEVLLVVGVACGLAVAVGWFDRVAAVLAAFILAWLFQRNPLIANPSLPLLGWLLVLHVFVPSRPYPPGWRFPRHLFVAAWIVLAVAYSYSGYTKLLSPAWTDGETIRLVLENPLARDHLLRDFALALPPIFLKCLTWIVLTVELLFAPLALIRRARPVLWTAMLGAQLGFLCFLNFADLTFPMLLAHLLTFDPAWLRRAAPHPQPLLLFDGNCAFCNANVRFAMKEDQHRLIRFASLASQEAEQALKDVPRDWTGDTIVLVDERGHSVKSRAVAGVLEHLGGIWFLLGRILRAVPRPIADAGYDFVGRMRYRLGGKVDYCLLPPRNMR